MTIKLYMDYFSQPSRAVLSLLLMSKVPFRITQTRVSKKQTRKQSFLKQNPKGTVPFIEDESNGLKLSQSHAIMRYISRKHPQKVNSLYPINDHYTLAKIDEYLDFHHTNTRKCHYYIFNKVFAKNVVIDPQFVQVEARNNVNGVLEFINNEYLRDKSKGYLIGKQPTLADLSAYYELQFLILNGQDFRKWDQIRKWIKNMSAIPEIKQANKTFIEKLLPKINPTADLELT